MIISASRRTDIPAFYSEWFYRRIREGFVCVRNPVNPRQISRISLLREDVDGIVFWTKDPGPMLERLDEIADYPYYFQFTLNPYGTDIEPNVPSKDKTVIPAFKRLSDMIGPARVMWRYDPIIINSRYTVDYHAEYFDKLASRLSGYTNSCTISFLDIYKNTLKRLEDPSIEPISNEIMNRIAAEFSKTAAGYHISLKTCAEAVDLEKYKIAHGRCIDSDIFEQITGNNYKYTKDRSQRAECGCTQSVDIGAYDCCLHGCRYCYATHSPTLPGLNFKKHSPASPVITGDIGQDEIVTVRRSKSSADKQLKMDI